MLITKEQQEALVDKYIRENHTPDESNGFIDGLNSILELISKIEQRHQLSKGVTNQIEIHKGQEANKLFVMRELMQGIENMFETVKRKDVDSIEKFFGGDNKIVSKRNFKAKLIIEFFD